MVDDQLDELAIHVLQAAGVAQAANEPLPIDELARTHDVSPTSLLLTVEHLEQVGLMLGGLEEAGGPILLNAGRQYLDRHGDVPIEVLRFLSTVVDDLNAREALIHAGTILVDTFRDRLLNDAGVVHAAELVPPAFAQAVDGRLALDLFAAAVALMAHLSDGRPAACVAEEILAVRLIEEAQCYLDLRAEEQEFSVESATAELKGIFELFEDDDVLDLFEMGEPSDAALAGRDPLKRELGVVDQRIEAWFEPFGWATPTGYIGR